jgi:hypothetical protein
MAWMPRPVYIAWSTRHKDYVSAHNGKENGHSPAWTGCPELVGRSSTKGLNNLQQVQERRASNTRLLLSSHSPDGICSSENASKCDGSIRLPAGRTSPPTTGRRPNLFWVRITSTTALKPHEMEWLTGYRCEQKRKYHDESCRSRRFESKNNTRLSFLAGHRRHVRRPQK